MELAFAVSASISQIEEQILVVQVIPDVISERPRMNQAVTPEVNLM